MDRVEVAKGNRYSPNDLGGFPEAARPSSRLSLSVKGPEPRSAADSGVRPNWRVSSKAR